MTRQQSEKTDSELVVQALAGGPEAFGPIVDRYRDAVFGVALARLRDFHDAQDTAQTVFIEAYQRLSSLKDPSRLGIWLRLKAVGRSLDLIRQRRDTIDIEELEEKGMERSTEEHESRESLRDRVLEAIGKLSNAQRETVTLYYINGYSITDVAKMQEVPEGTIKARLHEARKKLKQEMMDMVKEVLHKESPREDFGKQVFEILLRYNRPDIPWKDWGKVEDELRRIGPGGLEGFMRALTLQHSPTRKFAAHMLCTLAREDEAYLEPLKKSLEDANKKVRKLAFYAIHNLMEKDPKRVPEMIPLVLPLLEDRSRLVRMTVAHYLTYTQGLAQFVPVELASKALLDETNKKAHPFMKDLLWTVLNRK